MAKLVVTGGAGFIGSHLVEETCREHEVLVVDDLHTGRLDNIRPFMKRHGVRHARVSVTDFEALLEIFKGAESVFHFGALISVPESMERATDYVRVNTIGTLHVLEAARRRDVHNVVLSSSAAVYGDNPASPKREDMAPEPKSPYAVSKLDGEYYCAMYAREHGLNATALRYFNVFGPRQDPASQYAAAIPIFVSKALGGEPIPVFGDGEQTRDFIYVKDVVQANLRAAELASGGVFNVASGAAVSINRLIAKVLSVTGSSSEVRNLPERAGDIRHSLADIALARNRLNFQPRADFEQGLERTIAFFAGNMNS